jgi:Undecaprenyl-phosphate glucose phosphotransferase
MKPDYAALGAFPGYPRREQRGLLQPQQLRYLSIALDLLLFCGAGWLAAWRAPASDLSYIAPSELYGLSQFLASALFLVLFLGLCHVTRAQSVSVLFRDPAPAQLVRALVCYGAPPFLALLACLPFYGTSDPAVQHFIGWLKWFAVTAAAAGFLSRAAFVLAYSRLSSWMCAPQRIAVVGSGEAARRMIQWVKNSSDGVVEIVGVFDDRVAKRSSEPGVSEQVRGNTSDLIELYKTLPFDKIVMALPHSAEQRLLDLLRRLRQLPVDIVLAPDLIGFRSAHRSRAELAGLTLYSLADRPIREPQRLVKGSIDRMLAGIALLALSPLLIAVSLAIKLDSRGPVLFRQRRQGLGDTLFDVYKFRTMHRDLGDARGQQQTLRDDPRVTRLGAWLRRSSIDELPQLLNVLRGDMSLVGPRPHTPHMLIGDKGIFDLIDEYSFRHRVKPGITGLAQVNGYRGAIDTPAQLQARVDYDLYYIDHWSLWLDVKILCQTVFVCLRRVNAF